MQTSATQHTVVMIPEGQVVVVCPKVVSAESRMRVIHAIAELMTERQPPPLYPPLGLAELAALEAMR